MIESSPEIHPAATGPRFLSDDPEVLDVFLFSGTSAVNSAEFDYRDPTQVLPPVPGGRDYWVAMVVTGDSELGNNITLASGASPSRFAVGMGVETVSAAVFTTGPERFSRSFGVDFDARVSIESSFELGRDSGRAGFSMTELPDGRLLVAGGVDLEVGSDGVVSFGEFRDTIEVYDPATGFWSALTETGCIEAGGFFRDCVVRLAEPVALHTSSVFSNGQVVFAGGLAAGGGVAEYVASGSLDVLTFSDVLEGSVVALNDDGGVSPRAFHTATAVARNRVLLIGGISGSYSAPNFPQSVDELRLEGGQVVLSAGVSELLGGRAAHSAEYFSQDFDGQSHGIIVAGGRNGSDVLDSTEIIYLDGQGSLEVIAGSDLAVARFGAAATTYIAPGDIDDDTGDNHQYWVLAGGYTQVGTTPGILNGSAPTGSIENYVVRDAQFNDSDGDQVADTARAFAMVVNFPLSGDLLIAGGIGADGSVLDSGTWLVQREDGADGWYSLGGWEFETTSLGGPIRMSTPRAFGQAVTLPSMFGFFVGGTNGTSSLSSADFYNNNDYRLPF